jgi:hypothetical protein
MEEFSITEQQLFHLIDGKCSADEARKIRDRIDSSKEVKDKYLELLLMNKTMSDHNLLNAPQGFLESVMSGLESRKFIVEDLFDSINKLGLKFIVLMSLMMFATLYYVTNEAIPLNFNRLIENTTIVKDYGLETTPIDTFLNDKLIVNGMLFFGLIVTLILFDKVILKPWFKNRSTGY